MKYLRQKSGVAQTTKIVELEGDEVNLSDKVLITMVDNSLTSITNEQAERWNEKGVRAEGCNHFGGYVIRRNGRMDNSRRYAEVVIYID